MKSRSVKSRVISPLRPLNQASVAVTAHTPNTGVHSCVDSLYRLVTTASANARSPEAHRISYQWGVPVGQWGKSAGILELNLRRQSGRSSGTSDAKFTC